MDADLGSQNSSKRDDLSFDDVIEGDIFELAGIKVDDAERAELMEGLLKIVRIRVLDRIDEQLRDNEREQLKAILESEGNSKEELQKFMNGLGLDLMTISSEEAAKVKIEFLTHIKMTKEAGDSLADFFAKIKQNEI